MRNPLCIFLSVLLVFIACPLSRGAVAVGDKPTLHFTALDGSEVDLAKLKGKIVVVDFWDLNVDAARSMEKRLVELAKEHADDGVVFIGICCERDLPQATKFMQDAGITWPEYWDGKGWASRICDEWDHKHFGPVLIGPDGSVLWAGWYQQLDKQLTQALVATPPTIVDPDVLSKANASLDTVDKALGDGDTKAALQAFAAIPDDASKNKVFAKRMADIKPKLLEAIPPLLAPADDLIKQHHNLEALNTLRDLFKTFKGTLAESDIEKRVSDLQADPQTKAQSKQAESEAGGDAAIAAARKLRDDQKVGAAYQRLKDILTDFPGTAAAGTAAEMIKAYEQDPKLMEQVKEQTADDECTKLLGIARAYAAAGNNDQARAKFQQIIDQYPATKQADAARQELEELK